MTPLSHSSSCPQTFVALKASALTKCKKHDSTSTYPCSPQNLRESASEYANNIEYLATEVIKSQFNETNVSLG